MKAPILRPSKVDLISPARITVDGETYRRTCKFYLPGKPVSVECFYEVARDLSKATGRKITFVDNRDVGSVWGDFGVFIIKSP